MKMLRIFGPRFFLINFFEICELKRKKTTLTFFMQVYIFSDCCLKNHEMFICHFVVDFLEIL